MAAFYWPMLFVGPWLALRSRHPCFFTAANPGIFTGGMGLESKRVTLEKIPEAWRPRTILVKPGESKEDIDRRLREAGIAFPLVAKPDLGYRGMLVRKVDGPADLFPFLYRHPVPFLLQEYLDYPEEVGVLYYRLPGDASGTISSLTLKTFLSVRGDGYSTVEELIENNPRAYLQRGRIQELYPGLLDKVPEAGEKVPLGMVGNHAKGTAFLNGHHQIDQALVETLDRVALTIDGFNYGRFDIKCRSLEDLRQGEHFKIIELNGVCSEPTHIYDANTMTYPRALWAIIRHWMIVRRIAAGNYDRGARYLPPGKMFKAILDWRSYLKRLSL